MLAACLLAARGVVVQHGAQRPQSTLRRAVRGRAGGGTRSQHGGEEPHNALEEVGLELHLGGEA